MTVTEVSSHNHVQNTDSGSERQISGSTVRDAFTDLAQALQSGDLQGAQEAFETIQSARNVHINNTQTVTIGSSSVRDALITRAQMPRSDTPQTAYKAGLILLHPTIIDPRSCETFPPMECGMDRAPWRLRKPGRQQTRSCSRKVSPMGKRLV